LSSPSETLKVLTATSFPLATPTRTSAKLPEVRSDPERPSSLGSRWDSGRCPTLPHNLLRTLKARRRSSGSNRAARSALISSDGIDEQEPKATRGKRTLSMISMKSFASSSGNARMFAHSSPNNKKAGNNSANSADPGLRVKRKCSSGDALFENPGPRVHQVVFSNRICKISLLFDMSFRAVCLGLASIMVGGVEE